METVFLLKRLYLPADPHEGTTTTLRNSALKKVILTSLFELSSVVLDGRQRRGTVCVPFRNFS
jgi:hypothetical protein